jgi:hypothetical protein
MFPPKEDNLKNRITLKTFYNPKEDNLQKRITFKTG